MGSCDSVVIHYENEYEVYFLNLLIFRIYADITLFSSGIAVSLVLKYADNIVKVLPLLQGVN